MHGQPHIRSEFTFENLKFETAIATQTVCFATKVKPVWKSSNCCTNSQTNHNTHDQIVCETVCIAQTVWPCMGPFTQH